QNKRSDTVTSSDSAAGSLSSGDSYSAPSDDSEELMYSVSNPPSPDGIRKKQLASDTDSEKTATSDQSNSQVSSVVLRSEKEKQEEPVSVMAGFLNSLKKTTFTMAKMAKQETSEKPADVENYSKRVNNSTAIQAARPGMNPEDKSFFPFPGMACIH
ncbi:uncharacterized protein LOC110250392, partial [Exaiptasia diaphana]|uniref:Uncharacterized protein n=1 Tax=Exaiptasia diaphana TaxID=2652724 RepID=A0A913Y1K5_EXADI